MIIFPAIDLYEGNAVRLFKGDYNQMKIYSPNPVSVAEDFVRSGATAIHLVDLEGARNGSTPNYAAVCNIKKESGLFCEIGGGIRNMDTVEAYLSAGLDRVILGTAAVADRTFLKTAVAEFDRKIAVGADIRNGKIAVSGWTATTDIPVDTFFRDMQDIGISTVICTDISKDGVLGGTNRELYRILSETYQVQITASGGISSLDDIRALTKMNLYGAIIGKAYYEHTLDLKSAIAQAGGV